MYAALLLDNLRVQEKNHWIFKMTLSNFEGKDGKIMSVVRSLSHDNKGNCKRENFSWNKRKMFTLLGQSVTSGLRLEP